MKKAILVATIGAMTLGGNAGDWGKAPVGKAPIEDCVDIGGQISAGYMTDYYFRGMQAAEDSVWVDVNYTFDGLAVPVTVGVMYLNGIHQAEFDQLNLYVSAAIGTFFGFETSLGYAYHLDPETTDTYFDFGEVKLDARRNLGFADLVIGTSYTTNANGNQFANRGWYHHASLEKSIGLTDNISLVLAGGVGYLDGGNETDGAYQNGTGWNHYYARASFPIELNCRATLTPYVEYHNRGSGLETDEYYGGGGSGVEDNNISAGVALSVTF